VFLDILMPGMSGMALLNKIRAISSNLRVIMMTGKLTDDNLLNELRSYGAYSCLQKPFKIADLREMLVEIQQLAGGKSQERKE
jgi:DNA-binding NtrC family response regulator